MKNVTSKFEFRLGQRHGRELYHSGEADAFFSRPNGGRLCNQAQIGKKAVEWFGVAVDDVRSFGRGVHSGYYSERDKANHVRDIHRQEQAAAAEAERRRLKPPCGQCGQPTVYADGVCRSCRGKARRAAIAGRKAEIAAIERQRADSYMISQLLTRGWTRSKIAALLGEPDIEYSYRASHWHGTCTERRYMKARVHIAEATFF